MLRRLRLKNLALVDELAWELAPGFNLLTGETGAGKSILIDGLNLVLGERADKTLIRSGETACMAEAELELKPGQVKRVAAVLEEIGAEPCEDGALLLKRTCATTGTNKQFVNGSAVTLQALKRLGDLLVDVHGPHDHQSLLSVERQLGVLDAYGKLEGKRAAYVEAHDKAQELADRRAALNVSERERTQRLEMLTHQVKEIEGARLKEGEDADVDRDYRVASNARQLLELAGTITNLLGESESSVLIQLAQVEKALHSWEKVDGSLSETAALNRSAIANVQELQSAVQEAVDRIDLDSGRLQELEDRLNLIQSLKRKYGPSLAEVIAHGAKSADELRTLEGRDEELARLDKEEAKARTERDGLAAELSKARAKVAGPLAKQIQDELRGLGFAKALFRIDLAASPNLTRQGADRIEFIFAPNAGEEPRALRAIASSGEMARVMLAVKTTLAEVDEVPILVFDEVDANVGGETAGEVGRKLRGLGKSHQVLCITHLPQVAAQGQAHFSVQKGEKAGRTVTELTRLEGGARVKEIARMLGGQNAKAVALAESLLKEGSSSINK